MGIDDAFRRFYAARAKFHRKGLNVDGSSEPGLRADVAAFVRERQGSASPDEMCRLLTLQTLMEISDDLHQIGSWLQLGVQDYEEVNGLAEELELPEGDDELDEPEGEDGHA